jgi:thiol-disulfide isomerase/thioredoxin
MKKIYFILFLLLNLQLSLFAQRKGIHTLMSEHEFESMEGEKKSLSKILADYKGKVVYIDFWASWCAPCRKEMSYSKKLAAQLAQDSVVFLYLSLDEKEEDWKKAVKKLGLTHTPQTPHFRRGQTAADELLRGFYIYGIPHYLIFDKNGHPTDMRAPAPSNRKIKKKLIP